MFTNSILIKIIIGVIYGLVLGIITPILSKKLTLSRTEDPVKAAPIDKMIFKAGSVGIGILASVAVMLTSTDTALAIRNLLLLIPIASIAVVDALVRKIPNPLLLYMLIVQAVHITYQCVVDASPELLMKAFIGFIIGFAACAVPSRRLPIGSGDTKYSAIIGGAIYVVTYMQSILLMGLIAVGILIYLKATKKGGVKTMIPMGPLISISTVISICFPLLEKAIGEIGISYI